VLKEGGGDIVAGFVFCRDLLVRGLLAQVVQEGGEASLCDHISLKSAR